jgi:hypothetical protein
MEAYVDDEEVLPAFFVQEMKTRTKLWKNLKKRN